MKGLNLKRLLFEAGEEEEKDTDKDKPEDTDTDKDTEKEKEGDEDKEEDSEEEKKKKEEEEKKKKEENKPEDPTLEDSIDKELVKVLIDFESKARQSADQNKEAQQFEESFKRNRYSITKLLLNEDKKSTSEDIDVDYFTSEVARLVKNYQNLIDIEGIIVKKAQKFLQGRYNPEVEQEFTSKLSSDYGIEVQKPTKVSDEPLEQPIAVGARASGATP